ncbi:MAG: RNA pseudouridine synthase [Planctomycetota bacterium]
MSGDRELRVLHACNHVLCVAKPAGVPIVPDASGDESLLDRAKAWVKSEYAKPGAVFLGVVHRLDRPVSGVVCFARTSKGASRLSASFREGRAEKVYLAVTSRPLDAPPSEIEHFLAKDAAKNRVRVVAPDASGARVARTELRALATRADRTLVELRPITGRSHQLRVALASLHAPIVGDLKYGAPAPLDDKSIALHASRLAVPHPTRDEIVRVELEPPDLDVWRGWPAP